MLHVNHLYGCCDILLDHVKPYVFLIIRLCTGKGFKFAHISPYKYDSSYQLTHLPTTINWSSPFPILEVMGVFSSFNRRFCKETLKFLIIMQCRWFFFSQYYFELKPCYSFFREHPKNEIHSFNKVAICYALLSKGALFQVFKFNVHIAN